MAFHAAQKQEIRTYNVGGGQTLTSSDNYHSMGYTLRTCSGIGGGGQTLTLSDLNSTT